MFFSSKMSMCFFHSFCFFAGTFYFSIFGLGAHNGFVTINLKIPHFKWIWEVSRLTTQPQLETRQEDTHLCTSSRRKVFSLSGNGPANDKSLHFELPASYNGFLPQNTPSQLPLLLYKRKLFFVLQTYLWLIDCIP